MRAAAKAVSFDERVFMCVSNEWLSSILACMTQQGPCQLQAPGKNAIWKVILIRWRATRVTADSVRGQGGQTV